MVMASRSGRNTPLLVHLSLLGLLFTVHISSAEQVLPSGFDQVGRRLLAEDRVQPAQPAAVAAAPEVFWVLLVGDSQTGKTSLINRLLSDTFSTKYTATEGAYSKQHPLQMPGRPARLQIWDTAGQEAFRKVVTSIYRNIQAVLVTYDPHNRTSFDSAQRLWLPEVQEFAEPNAMKLLVGTKSDMGNTTVAAAEAQQVADAAGIEYITTSALNNQNVTSLFNRLGEDIYARRHPTSQS